MTTAEHQPDAQRVLAHVRERYGIDAVDATRLSMHKTYVFRVDRRDGAPWIARAFPPDRPRARVVGDAAILNYLERQGYPAERTAIDDPVSDLDGGSVLVTGFVDGSELPDGPEKFAMMGELLGRLHALPHDGSADRPGGASGEDPDREGAPRQDLLAAWPSWTPSTPRSDRPSATGSSDSGTGCARPTTATACPRHCCTGTCCTRPTTPS